MSLSMSFSLMPDMVFVDDDKTTLKFVAQNTSKTDFVIFKVGRGGSKISLLFPQGADADDLVSNLNFSGDPVNEKFVCNPGSGNFDISATEETQIAPGDTLEVIFTNVPINASHGEAKVNVSYTIGDPGESGSTDISVTKKPQDLGVIAWLDPASVALDQSSPLQYRSVAATSVVISGFSGGSGEVTMPPGAGSVDVSVELNASGQRTFMVTAWANGNQSPPESVTLTEVAPYIYQYSPTEQQTVAPGAQVTLDWRTHFESGNSLQWLEYGKENVQPPLDFIPGTELLNLYNVANGSAGTMPDTVTFDLTVEGFRTPAKQEFVFKVAPAQLNYLKYQDEEMTQIVRSVSPDSWARALDLSFGNESAKLIIYQPGYQKDTYYLSKTDTVNPMIQFFEAKDGELKWITANLVNLTLRVTSPGSESFTIAASDINNGTHIIPAGAGTMELTGENSASHSIRSVLVLN